MIYKVTNPRSGQTVEMEEDEILDYIYDNIDIDDCEEFDEIIDDSHEDIKIFSLTYLPSYVLKKVDPVAYREMIHNYMDSEFKDVTGGYSDNILGFEIVEKDSEIDDGDFYDDDI